MCIYRVLDKGIWGDMKSSISKVGMYNVIKWNISYIINKKVYKWLILILKVFLYFNVFYDIILNKE